MYMYVLIAILIEMPHEFVTLGCKNEANLLQPREGSLGVSRLQNCSSCTRELSLLVTPASLSTSQDFFFSSSRVHCSSTDCSSAVRVFLMLAPLFHFCA